MEAVSLSLSMEAEHTELEHESKVKNYHGFQPWKLWVYPHNNNQQKWSPTEKVPLNAIEN